MATVERDLISDVLALFGFRAQVFASPSVCGDWQINTTGMHRASFHLVARGACWLHLKEQPPRALRAGDLVVFPNDAWHVLSAGPALAAGDDATRVPTDQPGPHTDLVCGHFEFAHGYDNPVLASMPDCILVQDEGSAARIGAIVDLIAAEAAQERPGRQVVLDKLSDALFVLVLRHHLASAKPSHGWLAASADSAIGKALSAIHREPGRPWQLVDLAQRAGLSRTVFVERFTRLLGEPPMSYLTRWRMRVAERLLADPDLSVEHIAERLGYDTTAAFRRAFKRVTGRPPGALRQRSA
jgi:AraC family transcriptional regulator, activator of mtrCDE